MRWSVLGVGVAGRARCRAIVADPRAELACVWRGRFAGDAGAPEAADLDGAIGAADAVAVASPTPWHAGQIRTALAAGRHVLAEFPVATGSGEASRLFALARAGGQILHVAHIELLTPVARLLRGEIVRSSVIRAAVTFDGPGGGTEDAAALALANVARLMRLADACGPVAEVEPLHGVPGALTARLTLASGAIADARFSLSPGASRRTTLEIEVPGVIWRYDGERLTRNGSPVTLPDSQGLFAEDQLVATARILDGAAPYVTEGAIVHGLDLAESLSKAARSRVGATKDCAALVPPEPLH